MNNYSLRNARYRSLLMDFILYFQGMEEYHISQKSRCLANLREMLFQVNQCQKSGDAQALKNLCARLRHPLKSLNSPRLNRLLNEICFDENEYLPAKLTHALETLCKQLVDEIRAELNEAYLLEAYLLNESHASVFCRPQ